VINGKVILKAPAQEKQAPASEYISAVMRLTSCAYDQTTVTFVFLSPSAFSCREAILFN